MGGSENIGLYPKGENIQPIKSDANPTNEPAIGPKRSPERKIGTASMEYRLASLGTRDIILDTTTVTAQSTAQEGSAFNVNIGFF